MALRRLRIEDLRPRDRRELRNFQRVLKLLHAGRLCDMLERPRFRKYLGFTAAEVKTLQQNIAARVRVMIARMQQR